MGMAKREWMEAHERGWVAAETFVCSNCVEDAYLKSTIDEQVCAPLCSYCGRSDDSNIAAPLASLMEAIARGVHYYFNDPTHAGVPWDEGAPVVAPTDTCDVLMTLGLECHPDLYDDIVGAFSEAWWVPAAGGHWASSHEHDTLEDSWDAFRQLVRHETRFYFQTTAQNTRGPARQEFDAMDLLPMIGQLIENCSLVKEVDQGTRLYRVRLRSVNEEWTPDAEQLGAPPAERARAGRMNPAGIAYLYTALDADTALAETVPRPPVEAVVAMFDTTRRLCVIDLTVLPELPSVFSDVPRALREEILFLQSFVEEIAIPVTKDGSEHAPRVTIVVASIEPRTSGAAMKEISGEIRTNIQEPGGCSVAAA